MDNDRGFRQFLKWEEVLNPDKGYIKDDSVTVEVDLETDAPDDAPKAFFSFTVDNISTLNSIRYSSPFYAQSMPWVIKIVPKSRKTFRFYLQCNEEGEFWSCFASANLFLLSHNSEQDYFNKKVEHFFSSKENEADFGDFIDWPVVFDPDEDYIKNDSLILKIYLDVDSPNGESYNSELCITRTEYTFNFTVENVSKMKDSKLSEPVYVGQLPWMIKVAPLSGQNEKKLIEFLGVFLQCNEKGESWRCHADAELRLLSYRREQECFARKIKHLFCSKNNDWGFNRFMKWQDVLNPVKGYINNDSITLQVHIVVKDEREND
ncbi:ubiquitin carboxyl-terminal hydrolase 7-like isoform X2 [Leptopilina heterotoma]|nr:ubiquitin carboxyl-terminal hydrolase 7-like isoform X2 [Leptopilina heterotoma]